MPSNPLRSGLGRGRYDSSSSLFHDAIQFAMEDLESRRLLSTYYVNMINTVCDSNGYGGIFTSHSDYVLIQGNTTTNTKIQHGIYVSNACVNPVVRNNIIWGNYGCGIHMNGDKSQGGTGIITGALV